MGTIAIIRLHKSSSCQECLDSNNTHQYNSQSEMFEQFKYLPIKKTQKCHFIKGKSIFPKMIFFGTPRKLLPECMRHYLKLSQQLISCFLPFS